MVKKFIYESSELEEPRNSWPILDFIASPITDLISVGGIQYHVMR